ncbi:MAG TPA: zinc-dependent metalloprotease family protein, partial [Blastococcus sp.]
MPLSHPSPRRRSRIVAIAAVVLLPLLLPAVASADDGPSRGETVVGELVQAWPEHENHDEAVARSDEGPLTWIETDAGETVRVPTGDLAQDLTGDPGAGADLPVGATVQVVLGGTVTDTASTEQGLDPARGVLSAEVVDPAPAEQPTLGAAVTNTVTVVMMIPPGGAAEPGRTLADVVAAVNGPVNDFWNTESNGAVQVVAAATNYDWFQGTADCSNPTALWNEAATHAGGWTSGAGKHLLVYLPRGTAGCAYGLAQIGSDLNTGGRLYVTDVATSVIAHEFGHNFGLGHSSAKRCYGTWEAATGCRTEAYSDYYDVMGFSWDRVGSLNAPQAARLGVLPSAQQQVVSAGPSVRDTTFTLLPTGDRAGLRALKLVVPPGMTPWLPSGATYWLEYRAPTGRDAWLGTPAAIRGLQPGVLLRRAASGSDTSLLLDGTPVPGTWDTTVQDVLPVGRTVPVGSGALNVTVESVTPTGATVRVTGAPPVGNFEALSASGPTITVIGWAFDPDSTSDAIPVHVYVDGQGVVLSANGSRPDVGAAFPGVGDAHGFSWSGAVAPGTHTVCAYAIDGQLTGRDTALGCRTVTTQLALPRANWDSLSASGSSLTVSGWAFDPDDGGSSVPVHVYVDGQGMPVVTANGSRPDVGAAFPGVGDGHGFSWSTTVAPGEHRVCLYAIDADLPWRNTPRGCRTIATQLALPRANWDSLSASGSS